jgi:hypothetical protein
MGLFLEKKRGKTNKRRIGKGNSTNTPPNK